MKVRFLLQPGSVLGSVGPALLRALTVLTWGPLSHLQAGAEGREGEGCGTVGLLLEHSFEIGESSNFLVWALTRCPVKNLGLGATQCETRHPLTKSFAPQSVFALFWGGWGREGKREKELCL